MFLQLRFLNDQITFELKPLFTFLLPYASYTCNNNSPTLSKPYFIKTVVSIHCKEHLTASPLTAKECSEWTSTERAVS